MRESQFEIGVDIPLPGDLDIHAVLTKEVPSGRSVPRKAGSWGPRRAARYQGGTVSCPIRSGPPYQDLELTIHLIWIIRVPNLSVARQWGFTRQFYDGAFIRP